MLQSKATNVRSAVGISLAVLLLVGAGLVGNAPYAQGGVTVCPSTFQTWFGANSTWLSMVDTFTGGACSKFHSTMGAWFWVLAVAAVASLVVGFWRNRRLLAPLYPAYAQPAPGTYPAQGTAPAEVSPFAGVPAEPAHAPGTGTAVVDPTQVRTTGVGFDWRLVAGAAGVVVALVAVSFLVQALSFLPGLLQLFLWAAVELTVIWQVLRYTAKGDPGKLARAERWNPANVARTGYQHAKAQWAAYRAARPQPQAAPWAPAPAPASPYAQAPAEAPTAEGPEGPTV